MRHRRKPKYRSTKVPANLQRAPRRLLSKVLGDERRRLGKEREAAVVNALNINDDGALPIWIQHVSLATREEDRRGIDIVVITDVGKIYLQIKGTQRRVEQFVTSHRKGNIVPFIVDVTLDKYVLRGMLIGSLKKERERILALRSAR